MFKDYLFEHHKDLHDKAVELDIDLGRYNELYNDLPSAACICAT